MTYELKSWLHSDDIPTSKSTRYNPKGNGQVKILNLTIWQTVQLALRTKNCHSFPGNTFCQELCMQFVFIYALLLSAPPHKRMFIRTRKTFNGYHCLPG